MKRSVSVVPILSPPSLLTIPCPLLPASSNVVYTMGPNMARMLTLFTPAFRVSSALVDSCDGCSTKSPADTSVSRLQLSSSHSVPPSSNLDSSTSSLSVPSSPLSTPAHIPLQHLSTPSQTLNVPDIDPSPSSTPCDDHSATDDHSDCPPPLSSLVLIDAEKTARNLPYSPAFMVASDSLNSSFATSHLPDVAVRKDTYTRKHHDYPLRRLWEFYDRPYGHSLPLSPSITVHFTPYLSALQIYECEDRRQGDTQGPGRERRKDSRADGLVVDFYEHNILTHRAQFLTQIDMLESMHPRLKEMTTSQIDLARSWFSVVWVPIVSDFRTASVLIGNVITYHSLELVGPSPLLSARAFGNFPIATPMPHHSLPDPRVQTDVTHELRALQWYYPRCDAFHYPLVQRDVAYVGTVGVVMQLVRPNLWFRSSLPRRYTRYNTTNTSNTDVNQSVENGSQQTESAEATKNRESKPKDGFAISGMTTMVSTPATSTTQKTSGDGDESSMARTSAVGSPSCSQENVDMSEQRATVTIGRVLTTMSLSAGAANQGLLTQQRCPCLDTDNLPSVPAPQAASALSTALTTASPAPKAQSALPPLPAQALIAAPTASPPASSTPDASTPMNTLPVAMCAPSAPTTAVASSPIMSASPSSPVCSFLTPSSSFTIPRSSSPEPTFFSPAPSFVLSPPRDTTRSETTCNETVISSSVPAPTSDDANITQESSSASDDYVDECALSLIAPDSSTEGEGEGEVAVTPEDTSAVSSPAPSSSTPPSKPLTTPAPTSSCLSSRAAPHPCAIVPRFLLDSEDTPSCLPIPRLSHFLFFTYVYQQLLARARTTGRLPAEVLSLLSPGDVAHLNEIVAHAANLARGRAVVPTPAIEAPTTTTAVSCDDTNVTPSASAQTTSPSTPGQVPLAPASFVPLQERAPACLLTDAHHGERLIHIDLHPYLAYHINVRNSMHPDLARVVKLYIPA